MMIILLLKSESAVTTGMCTRLIQVDVHFGVAEMLVSACAGNNTLFAFDDWLFCNQIDGPALVDNFGGIREAHVSVVIFIVGLKEEQIRT